jgi:molybdopterin-dependent oxidoreductase alpha subunit
VSTTAITGPTPPASPSPAPEPAHLELAPAVLSDNLIIHPPEHVAAGLPAVISALDDALTEMGPTRSARELFTLNQFNGFDCPGCAWPDPHNHRSIQEYCENGAKAVAEEATKARVTPAFFAQYGIDEIARHDDFWIGKRGRITHPMYRAPGATHYAPIEWSDAFSLIARHLSALPSPDEAVFYTSGRTSNEAAFVYQLFARRLGTNNLPDCSNMCHESSGYALSHSIGVGKGTVTLEDFDHADVVLLIGQNPGTNHPRMLTQLQKCAWNKAKIISVNPLHETGLLAFRHPQKPWELLGPGTKLTTQFLQVRINGDQALLRGIAKALFARETAAPGSIIDATFVHDHTEGFDAWHNLVDAEPWERIEAVSGIARADIETAAETVANGKRIIACWAMGLTQHKNAVPTIQEVVNILLMRGMFGKPGAGACPVRGHSNVQGDRTMGIWEQMPESFHTALDKEFGFVSPRKHGFDVVAAIQGMHEGPGKVFFGMGGNFLSATPDTVYTAEALRNCALTVHVSTKLNRSHCITGTEALILPCLGRTEIDEQATGRQFVTVEDSMSVVHQSHGGLKPASPELKSETAIICELADRMFGGDSSDPHPVQWLALRDDYDRIRDHIAAVVPGFHEYNPRVRERGGFYLGNPTRELTFPTASGHAQFMAHPLTHVGDRSDAAHRFILMTMRSHDQFNTTIYGLNDRYRGIKNERRIVLMHEADMTEAGFAARQPVDVTSYWEGQTRVARRFVVLPYDVPRGCLAAYYPETNVLVPIDSVADGSRQPTSKSIIVSLAPAA